MRKLLLALSLVALPAAANAQLTDNEIIRYQDLQHPVLGDSGMVAAQNRLSAEAGAKVLAAGGNAVDAAIATGFSLAVTLPRAGNLGGGGFMLIHDAESGEDFAVDYREIAPQSATRDMYLDENGDVDKNLARFSHLAAGVPGTVAGFYFAHQKFGRLPWKRLRQTAIQQAREGIVVSHDMAELLKVWQKSLCRDEAACGYFFKKDGVPYEAGDLFVQSDLAGTLQLIADQGPDAFYEGRIAEQIIAEMQRGGGLINAPSLAAYEPIVRTVMRGTYRGYEIVTMPPPSSGGIHILQMLNILEFFPVAGLGAGSADNVHLLAEVARLAYADRSKHVGDPNFYKVPVDWLTSKAYGRELAATIDLKTARKSDDVAPGVATL